MLEVETHGSLTAAQLVHILGLEKSSVSRMLAKLVEAGELEETPSADDARTKQLSLTGKGRETMRNINAYADQRVAAALNQLDPSTQNAISHGLSSYAGALKACRENTPGKVQTSFKIVSGYHAGMIGRITEMHSSYYAREHNFGNFFEAKVATGIADFSARLDKSCNQIWLAMMNERIVGSVAIDGEDLGKNEAHLRWFIIDDNCRGSGIDRKLIEKAMDFCDEHKFSAVQLWTFNKLTAARRLYESFGFELSKEWEGDQWGSTITEQQLTRTEQRLISYFIDAHDQIIKIGISHANRVIFCPCGQSVNVIGKGNVGDTRIICRNRLYVSDTHGAVAEVMMPAD